MNAMLADIAQLHFLRPWWLLALLLLPVLMWWWRADARRRSPWQDAVDAHLLPHLLDITTTSSRRSWARWLGLLAAILLVLAMAGRHRGCRRRGQRSPRCCANALAAKSRWWHSPMTPTRWRL